jgi:hypothetical protein
MTLLLEAPTDGALDGPEEHRSRLPLIALLLVVAGLVATALVAVPRAASFGAVSPTAVGVPWVTVPEYGAKGAYILGYEHEARVRLTVPIRNTGRLPVTVTSVDLGGGIAPLVAVDGVDGLPMKLGPGSSGSVVLRARMTNCRYYHERAQQNFAGVAVGFSSLWRTGTRTVAFDRPIMVKGPMLVGCPGRKLDRSAENRIDLL